MEADLWGNPADVQTAGAANGSCCRVFSVLTTGKSTAETLSPFTSPQPDSHLVPGPGLWSAQGEQGRWNAVFML